MGTRIDNDPVNLSSETVVPLVGVCGSRLIDAPYSGTGGGSPCASTTEPVNPEIRIRHKFLKGGSPTAFSSDGISATTSKCLVDSDNFPRMSIKFY